MDFWDLTKLLYRRWFVSVPLILLTLGGTVAAAMLVKPDYVATSYVQLIPPSVSTREPEGKVKLKIIRNPWLDTGLNSLAKAALLTVQDTKVADQLDEAGFSDKYTITLDNQLPTLTFEVVGTSPQQAKLTTDELTKRFSASALALQRDSNAPTEQLVDTLRLDQGDNITKSTSKTKRALVAIFGAGLLVSVGVTVAFDALLRRRGRRKADAAQSDGSALDAFPPGQGSSPMSQRSDERRPARSVPQQRISPGVTNEPSVTAPTGGVATSFEETKRLRPPDELSVDATVVLPVSWTNKNGRATPR